MERSFHAQAALLLAERIGWHLRLAELPCSRGRAGLRPHDLFGGFTPCYGAGGTILIASDGVNT
jgi:hypothetical protein